MNNIYIVLLVGLLICSWEDVRSYMISLPFTIIWTGLLCGMQIYYGNMDLLLLIAPIATIGITAIVSHLSKGGIGPGDGFLFAMAVAGLGVMQSIRMFIYCLTGAFCAAVIALVFFSGKKDSRIPLAPFILGGSILAIL